MKKQLLCALAILALLLPCAGLAERNALEGTAWQGIDRDTLYTLTFRDGTYCLASIRKEARTSASISG